MTIPHILGIGTATPRIRLTQEQSFYITGYQSERIRKIFLNSYTEYLDESSDEQNERYLSGAMKTGCRAIMNCLGAADASVKDVAFLAVCSCTGYVCPDVGSRLVAHMKFRNNVQRASIIGLGCAGAVPTLQRVVDFVRANHGGKALMLAVEICSACYYVDNTLETVIGNAICAMVQLHFCLEDVKPRNMHIRELSISRRSLIRSRSEKWDFNTVMASYELSCEHRCSTSRLL